MKRLIEFSVRNPVTVNLLALFVLGAGLTVYFQIHRELFPDFSRQAIQITTSFAGASPEEVETLITAKIEQEMANLDELEELLSVSQEGRSEILLKFRPETDMSRALADARAALDDVTGLPEEADRPQLRELKSAFPVITVSLAGDIQEAQLRELGKDLRDRLRRLPGVAAVRVLGLREPQIWVEADPARLEQYGLSLEEIRAAIAAHNRNVPGGTLKTARGEILVRTLGEAAGAEEVERIILRSAPAGTPIRVGDLAGVRETFEEPTTLGRWAGRPAVNLVVTKERTGDAIDIAAAVRGLVDRVRPQLPATVQIGVFNDFSVFIQNRLNTLRTSGLIGLGIVVVILWAFLRTRIALFTGLGIPFAVLGGIALMAVTGISLNMMSLFALILVLGLLVDDAIVVTENVYRHVEQGMDSHQAAVRGTTEVAWPVVATVTTTVAAFVPLLLLPGMMGVFLAPIPIVVCFALLASLVEALCILPSHLAEVITPAYARTVRHREVRWLERLRGLYRALLALTLRWRYVTVALLVSVTVLLSAAALYRLPFVLFQEFESSQFLINLETSPASKIEDTLETAKRAEAVVLRLPPGELRSVSTNVGLTFLDVHRVEFGPNLGQLMVELEEERLRSVDAVIADLREGMAAIPGIAKIQFLKTQSGPGGPAIEARIVGDEIPVLRSLATDVKSYLQTIPGVRDIRDDFTEGKEEIQIRLLPEARALGLTLQQVARQIQQAFLGVEASSIQRRDEDIPIIVRFPQAARQSLDTVSAMKISLPSGEQVFLREIARLESGLGASKIRRDDQKRTVTVLADVDTREANAFQVAQRLKREFAGVGDTHRGYRVAIKGERQEAEESLAALPKISLVALLLIYFMLGSLFKSFVQPLVVMAAIPFALDGVIIGHLLMGEPLTFLSLMGLIALTGVVVNDSLILVDFINRARLTGSLREEAILAAGVSRLRPVLLTTLTTVGGLVPLAFFSSGQAKFLAPMALAVVWGLSFATLLTLILIPCLYAILDDLRQGTRRLLGLQDDPSRSREPVPPGSAGETATTGRGGTAA